MPDEYLKIKCRNKQRNTPLECRAPLGGPSIETLLNHDYEKSPFVDIRLCRNCHTMIKTTINNLNDIPTMESIPKDVGIKFREMEDVFGFIEVRR